MKTTIGLSTLVLLLCSACGGGGSDPSPDVGRYALDVGATFELHDIAKAATPDERNGLVRSNAQAQRASEDERFGLTLQDGGGFVLQLGSDEKALGTWAREGEEIRLSTTQFDGTPVDPPETSTVQVIGGGKLSFTAGGVRVQLIRR